jgi:hypothetical protein
MVIFHGYVTNNQVLGPGTPEDWCPGINQWFPVRQMIHKWQGFRINKSLKSLPKHHLCTLSVVKTPIFSGVIWNLAGSSLTRQLWRWCRAEKTPRNGPGGVLKAGQPHLLFLLLEASKLLFKSRISLDQILVLYLMLGKCHNPSFFFASCNVSTLWHSEMAMENNPF